MITDITEEQFEEIYRIAERTYRHHKFGTRGQQISRADNFETHLIWATLRVVIDGPRKTFSDDDIKNMCDKLKASFNYIPPHLRNKNAE